jgi:hypothetical protein
MKLLPLTKGRFAKVDDSDFEYLSQFKWTVTRKYNNDYVKRSKSIKGVTHVVYLHRELMGFPVGMQVDHRNGDGLDNQRHNLRVCTKANNVRNRRRQHNQKNVYIGVQECSKGFRARIWSNGGTLDLGIFDTAIEAAKVRDRKAFELRGEFAHLNFHTAPKPE